MPKQTPQPEQPQGETIPEPPAPEPQQAQPAPAQADAPAKAEEESEPLQAVRVETYSVEDSWGYRRVASDGTVVHDSGTEWNTQKQALSAAHDDDTTEGLYFPDEDISQVERNPW